MWTLLSRIFGSGITAVPGEDALSRRRFILGIGAAGAVVAAGSLLVAAEPALAQPRYRDDDDDDRRRGRNDRRDDRRGRRMSRRELQRRCDRDRSFRRDNRGLCRSVSSRGRAGQCVQIGPFLVCD